MPEYLGRNEAEAAATDEESRIGEAVPDCASRSRTATQRRYGKKFLRSSDPVDRSIRRKESQTRCCVAQSWEGRAGGRRHAQRVRRRQGRERGGCYTTDLRWGGVLAAEGRRARQQRNRRNTASTAGRAREGDATASAPTIGVRCDKDKRYTPDTLRGGDQHFPTCLPRGCGTL